MKTPQNWQYLIWHNLHVSGITLYPFIVIKSSKLKQEKTFVNHEHIHLRQQAELLVLPFYMLYLLHYFFNLIRYGNHQKAYYNICFEREAYNNETIPNYLDKRKYCAWLRYL